MGDIKLIKLEGTCLTMALLLLIIGEADSKENK